MRHRKKKFTLGREKAARDALMRHLAESLVLHGSIRTSRAKARALRTVVEPLITRAKRGTLADQRAARRVLFTDRAVKKLMTDLGPKYKERNGGYTRLIKLPPRANDAAQMVRIEFV